MRRRAFFGIVPAILAGVLAFSSPAAAQTGLSRNEIDRISRTVVRIVALDGGEEVSSGSGTIVQAGGLIYTNRHVIEDADDFSIEILDDLNERPVPRYRARLVGYSIDVDFALLQIDRDSDGRALSGAVNLPFLAPSATDVQRGDRIYVFGYPSIGEGFLAFTEGAVTTIRNGTMDDRRMPVWYQTDAQISPGNSGGLVVNASSQIVGIPTTVLSEDRTGGRLGGILAINAVRAALDSGLESDLSRVTSGTTSPVIAGGRLDFSQAPHFGSVNLSAGFIPDPHTLEMVSGGEINVGYIGGACTGHAAMAPDYRLTWSGRSDELRIFFASEDGGDTTLLINRPDGSWICNDDAEGGSSLDPMVVLDNPTPGQYDVWVGSYNAGAFVSGALYITELDLAPDGVGSDELDLTLDPFFGSISLRAGFTPDPNRSDIVAGGSIDASYLGGSCVGFAAAAPDVRLNWSGRSDELRIFFEADEGDATIIVNLPDGTWICNDDAYSGTLDPMVVLNNPREGRYDIWVGVYDEGEFIDGALSITELDRRP